MHCSRRRQTAAHAPVGCTCLNLIRCTGETGVGRHTRERQNTEENATYSAEETRWGDGFFVDIQISTHVYCHACLVMSSLNKVPSRFCIHMRFRKRPTDVERKDSNVRRALMITNIFSYPKSSKHSVYVGRYKTFDLCKN